MRAEKALHALLAADAGVAALVANRIYPVVLAQGVAYPVIGTHKISAVRRPPIRAGAGQSLVDARVQVIVYGLTYADVKNVAEAVRLAADRQSGTLAGVAVVVVLLDLEGPDQYDPGNQVYWQALDFKITHYE